MVSKTIENRKRKTLFYFTPEPHASVHIMATAYGEEFNHIETYHAWKKPNPTLNICHRSNDGTRNAKINVGRNKQGRCESCGTKGNTEWAHILPNRDDLFAEMCIPCHRIYDFISNGE